MFKYCRVILETIDRHCSVFSELGQEIQAHVISLLHRHRDGLLVSKYHSPVSHRADLCHSSGGRFPLEVKHKLTINI